MKTHVMGKKIKNTYKVVTRKDDNGKYVGTPSIELDKMDITWVEICSYDGTPQKGQGKAEDGDLPWYTQDGIYISENEFVPIQEAHFRADLGDWYQYTKKILENKDVNLKKCEKELDQEMRAYNTQKIEANPKAKSYCNLHKLDYSETNYDELMDLLEGDAHPKSILEIKPIEGGTCDISKYITNTVLKGIAPW